MGKLVLIYIFFIYEQVSEYTTHTPPINQEVSVFDHSHIICDQLTLFLNDQQIRCCGGHLRLTRSSELCVDQLSAHES